MSEKELKRLKIAGIVLLVVSAITATLSEFVGEPLSGVLYLTGVFEASLGAVWLFDCFRDKRQKRQTNPEASDRNK
ncbi:MAG: hypothetical protein JHC26_03735 [Thermofilum sp.]|uniref:hypothetical protein n=1 Tax=Thermofilum sp. TaxID=1961369 RepID=UPI002585BCD0|nr:hypothetical protein [Thermofilum sp.]MCI4408179.1 hypothetical protein [Thermofilum sp.]